MEVSLREHEMQVKKKKLKVEVGSKASLDKEARRKSPSASMFKKSFSALYRVIFLNAAVALGDKFMYVALFRRIERALWSV